MGNNEPKTQEAAWEQAKRDLQNGTRSDTQNWSDAARQNYNNQYGNGPKK